MRAPTADRQSDRRLLHRAVPRFRSARCVHRMGVSGEVTQRFIDLGFRRAHHRTRDGPAFLPQTAYYVPHYHYLTPFYSPVPDQGMRRGQPLLAADHCPPRVHSVPAFIVAAVPAAVPADAATTTEAPTTARCGTRRRRARSPSRTRTTPARRASARSSRTSHRYFFYIAVIISLINTYDAIMAFHGKSPAASGFGLGNIILLVNVVDALGLHAVLPLVPAHRSAAGSSTSPSTRCATGSGGQVSKLNSRHMPLAWITLGTLMLTDFYVTLVASGTISDLRFVG